MDLKKSSGTAKILYHPAVTPADLAAIEFPKPPELPINHIDRGDDTFIKIGCYRETHRLDRVLETFHKALTQAAFAGYGDQLRRELVSLHDRKGTLTCVWQTVGDCIALRHFVNAAWLNAYEFYASHKLVDGRELFYEYLDDDDDDDGCSAVSR